MNGPARPRAARHARPRRLRGSSLVLAALLLTLPALAWMGARLHLPPATAARAAPAGDVAARVALHPPAVRAKSAFLMNIDTGAVLFQKFPDARRPMASTTKIMVGLLTAESGRLGEVAMVSARAAAIGESTMGLRQGEQVRVEDLLYGLLLSSGNDAAIALAEHLAGSVEAFVAQMNERAAQLGLTNTHYVNPHGLDNGSYYSPQHYSSARDLARLGAVAMANPIFARVAGTMLRDVPGSPGQPPHRLRHLVSQLWWYPGAYGIKTGWTGRAGQVRVVAARRAGVRLIAVVMDSPDEVGETRDLLDYGFAVSESPEARATVPLNAEALPLPDEKLQRAWSAFKSLALAPDGRVRRGAAGDEATSDAQAQALLEAVWMRDRGAFDALWSWTKASLTRRQAPPGANRDALFASRWAGGAVADWNNSTAADERLAAALLLASKLWNEPRYLSEAQPILAALLDRAAISWGGYGIAAANSFLNTLDPVTTSATTLTPGFYRLFAEAGRNSAWLWLLDGTYASLQAAMADDGPLGPGAGLLPGWFSVAKADGTVGPPIDPSWQSTGFSPEAAPLVWQLGLDFRWSGDPRPVQLLVPTAHRLADDLGRQGRIAASYARDGAATAAETRRYGALAAIALPGLEPGTEAALRARLDAELTSGDPDRLLDAMDGLWLLAGGPPNFWRIWWPPEDLPTARNDGVVPPDDGRPWRYFEETGHVVQGAFLDFFQEHGGLDAFGYPRTDELVEDGRTVQYFQRARFEWVPDGAGGGQIIPAALGRRAAAASGALARPEAQPVAPFESDETRRYFAETGHSLSGGFRTFYEQHGDLETFGAPLTEELTTAEGYVDQYFERAMLEYIPGRQVQATLLGDDLLREKGWLR
jgi:D-alanyl-D-alanine carboxypeptidase